MTDTTRPDGVLAAYAEGRIHHLNRGLCPDEVAGHSSRDPDCPVCAALSHAKPAEGGVVEAALAHLDALDDDAAVHIWPDDLEKCMTSECVVEVASVRMGSPDGKTLPLFSRTQVAEAIRAALSQRQAQEQHKGHWCSLDHGGVFCRQCDLNVIAQEQAAPAMPVEAHVKPKWTVERNGNAYYPCNGNAYYPLRILEGRREVAAFHSWNDHKESDAALIVAAVNAYRTAPAEAPAVPVGWTLTFSDERDFCLAASPLIGAAYVVGLQAVERINTSPWGRKTFGKVLATPPSPAEASPGGEPGPVIKYGPLYEYAEGRGLDYNELCKLVRAVAAHPTKLVPLTKWEVMSALSLCPTDLPHPRRCEWLAEALNRKLAEKSGIALADVRETRNAN